MKKSFLIVFIFPFIVSANPLENISNWFDDEYKNFRVHPRMSRAYDLIQEGKEKEARALLEKALEIDGENQQVVNMMMNLCIKQRDEVCIDKYIDQVEENDNLGYVYAYKAQKAQKEKQYSEAIEFAEKALSYELRDEDYKYIKLILFEAYLVQGAYNKADHIIDRDHLLTYDLLEWSKASSNLGDDKYAYDLVLELPNKKEYTTWRLELLLKQELYLEASKEMNKLYELDPSDDNLKQLVHLYDLTKQNKELLNVYRDKLKRGCDEYALLYLLEYYKMNKQKELQFLEKNYPFSCLTDKKRLVLSQKLLSGLKHKDPRKAKRIANSIANDIKSEKGRLLLYEESGQKDKTAKLYAKKLKRGCDEYALNYLMKYHKNSPVKMRQVLEQSYPFGCVSKDKQVIFTQKLIRLLNDKNPEKAKRFANRMADNVNSEEGRILLYQESGQEERIVQLHYETLRKNGCDEYALNYLLDHYQHDEAMQQSVLKESYPFKCLPEDKRSLLSMQLAMSFGDDDLHQAKPVLDSLDIAYIDASQFMNLSHIYSRLGDFQKSKAYAMAYLKEKPEDISALKAIGYSYFKLGDKKTSLEYLEQASELDSSDLELLKNLGYLSVELNRPEMAVTYWNRYLTKTEDPEVELELAALYMTLDQKTNAKNSLAHYRSMTQNPSRRYYLVQAKLASSEADCSNGISSYQEVLKREGDVHTSYEYAQLLKACNYPKKALAVLKQLSQQYPDQLLYKQEMAYMYEQRGEYDKAIENFKFIAEREPDNVKSYIALASVQKKAGDTVSAVKSYKHVVDNANGVDPSYVRQIKHEIKKDSSRLNVYASQTVRLDGDKGKGSYAPIPNALYDGFGFVELTYRPLFLPQNLTLFANVIHDHNDFTSSAQPAVGIRYKPFNDLNLYLSAQRMIEVGEQTRQDTMLRASLGISNKRKNPTDIYHMVYFDANYFVGSESKVFYGNYEAGKEYALYEGVKVSPYFTTGGSISDQNGNQSSRTNLDAGIGVALSSVTGETQYEAGLYTNRLKLEARRKYAGNSKDESTMRLQWEFFY